MSDSKVIRASRHMCWEATQKIMELLYAKPVSRTQSFRLSVMLENNIISKEDIPSTYGAAKKLLDDWTRANPDEDTALWKGAMAITPLQVHRLKNLGVVAGDMPATKKRAMALITELLAKERRRVAEEHD
mmetsp:Transcript_39801/g.127280  ORF Transcript_39801/g.127280 Transcript_39801/m.127280 type:complete len:130 (-) Transcript_39801:31-420(-)